MVPYSLGWFSQWAFGERAIWHYGHYHCYSAVFLKIPSRNLPLFLLANSDGLSAPFGLEAIENLPVPLGSPR